MPQAMPEWQMSAGYSRGRPGVSSCALGKAAVDAEEPRLVSAYHPAAVVVLAAGEGTRMKSTTTKVMHSICGRPLVGHAVAAAAGLEIGRAHV